MSPSLLIKEPDESRLFDVNFDNLLTDGETLSTSVVSSTPSGLTIGTPVISGSVVQFRISSGISGTTYYLTTTVTTSSGNTLEGCTQLHVVSCPWLYESVRILRELIGDVCETPTYSTTRLGELLLVAAQQILGKMTFANNYTIRVADLYLSPSPTDTATRDDVFISMMVLKAACIIDLGELRQRARLDGIKIKDSMGEIGTSRTTEGFRALIELGPCSLYKEAERQYAFGSTEICRAIMTPFSSVNLGFSVGWYDPRTRDYFS